MNTFVKGFFPPVFVAFLGAAQRRQKPLGSCHIAKIVEIKEKGEQLEQNVHSPHKKGRISRTKKTSAHSRAIK